MSNLQPVGITDKNGKQTTVHKKTEAATSSLRLKGSRPFVFTRTPEEIEAKQMSFISDLSHDYRELFPSASSFEIGSENGDEPYIVTTIADGAIVGLSENAEVSDIDGLSRALRNLHFGSGEKLGYIQTTEPNKRHALFRVDLDEIDRVVAEYSSRSE